MSKEWYKISLETEVPEIHLYGFIGKYEGVDYTSFQRAIRDMEGKYTSCTVRIHSGGGDMIEGLAMYDLMRNSSLEFTAVIEGMCASMATIIALAADKILITENGRWMTHKPQGACFGEAKKMREYADLMDNLEGSVTKIYKERTGKDEATVAGWLKDGKETWHNAQECLANGMVQEIVKSDKKVKAIKGKTPENIWQEIANCIITETTPKNLDMSIKIRLIGMLATAGIQNSLTAEDSDDKVCAAIENALKMQKEAIDKATTRATTAEKKVEDVEKASIKNMLDDAIKVGKITIADRPKWEERATKDAEMVKDALDAIPARQDINAQLGGGKKEGETTDPKNRDTWTLRDWEQKDSTGLLAKMKAEPEWYNKLFQAQYLD